MSIEENKAIQLRFQDIWSKEDFDIIEDIFDKDYLNHNVNAKGFESIRQYVTVYRSAFLSDEEKHHRIFSKLLG